MSNFEKDKEIGYGAAEPVQSDHPNAPKLKGWVKITAKPPEGFINFTLWPSKKKPGTYTITLGESQGVVKQKYDRAGDLVEEEAPRRRLNSDF